MPKFKRASSSLTTSRAKKKKRERIQQDSDSISDGRDRRGLEERRRERNTEARRIARLDPPRRQEEQTRDTAARRRVRLEDPERRQEEQTRDTAARRRVRQEDPERRQEEQIRNTEAHRAACEGPVRRMEQQQRDLIQRREARADPQYSAQEQQVNNARRQQVRAGIQANFRALNYQPDNFVNTTSVGLLSVQCQNCGALKFSKETDGFCCSKGNVKLDVFPQPQPFLQRLYEGTDSDSKHFLSNIRKYNCAFQMTSFGCNEVSMAGFNHPLEYRVRSTT